MVTEINYTTGDALRPYGKGTKIITHICNDIGGWGAGFVVALSKRWTLPETVYRKAFRQATPPRLGEVQFVDIPRMYTVGEGRVVVANMIAQHGIGWRNGVPPIRYDALELCLKEVAYYALAGKTPQEVSQVSVHMPRIGTGLAGGTWDKIESLIKKNLVDFNIPVTVYDLPKGRR